MGDRVLTWQYCLKTNVDEHMKAPELAHGQ